MKKLSLLFFLGLVLSGCLVDETNLDASESYLDEHGVNQSNKSRTLSFSGVIPDSLKVLRNPYTIWDKSLSLVGSDPGIGDANAGFGYILTGFASKLDSIKLNDLYKRPYVVFQFDSLFSEMSALTQSGHASTTLSYAIDYRVVLHRGLTNALYYDSLVVAVDGTGFDQNTSLFYSDLKDDSTASKSSVIYSASNQHVFNLLPSNNSSVHTELFQTGTKTLEAYRNPIKIYLDSLVGQLVAAQKDSTLHLSIILDDFGVYNPADSSIISVGLQRVAVDFPKPTLHFSDSIALSHSIDRYQLKRITEDSTQYENRIWGGLDTLSFRMPVDTLLSLFQDSLGEIKGIYSDHLVRKATVSFPIYDSSSVTELALPYTIEAKTATESVHAYNYTGYPATEEHQFKSEILKNMVPAGATTGVVKIDVTEAVSAVLSYGRVGVSPVTYFHISKSLRDAAVNFRYTLVEGAAGTAIAQDNRFVIQLYNSFDFSNVQFDLEVELIEIGLNK